MSMESTNKKSWGPTATWITLAIVSLIWWFIASLGSCKRGVLLVWLSLASLMVGALVGFLFSSYGEENSTLGKVRDWLVGGITALTVVNAGSIKGLLLVFAYGPGSIEFAFTVAAAIFYAGLGFFFMFFQRELILNVLLAKSRAERGKLEGSQKTGQVIQQFLFRLPASLLTGVDSIDEIPDVTEKEVKQLKDLLYLPDVETFLGQAEDAARNGALDWDVAFKTANIHYYRTYFAKDDPAQKDRAMEWITRALNMNPLHADLTMKYVDMLGFNEEYEAAVAILDRLMLRPEAPVLVKQWLGYYLRFLPDRLDEAIRYSEEYHRLFPDESDTFFNIGYVYGRKYCTELRADGLSKNLQSENREKALSNLKEGLREQPAMAQTVRKWAEHGKPLECLGDDEEFRAMAGPPDSASPAPSVPGK